MEFFTNHFKNITLKYMCYGVIMLLTKNKDATGWYAFHKVSNCNCFLLDCIIDTVTTVVFLSMDI